MISSIATVAFCFMIALSVLIWIARSPPIPESFAVCVKRPLSKTKKKTQPKATSPSPAARNNNPPSNEVDPEAIVRQINQQRSWHGVPTVTWSQTLANEAQKWADQCLFEHSRAPYGENIGLDYPSKTLDQFYNEVCAYDFNNPRWSTTTGHFTQTVWARTNEVGCAVGKCPNGTVDRASGRTYPARGPFVCMYNPPGNAGPPANFSVNVPPLQPGAPSSCRK